MDNNNLGFPIDRSTDKRYKEQREEEINSKKIIKNKIYPHNILFKENVEIQNHKGFIEQFLTPEIYKTVLNTSEFQSFFINNIAKESNVLKKTLNNSLRSLSKKVSEDIHNIKTEHEELKEQMNKLSMAFKDGMEGIDKRLNEIMKIVDNNKSNTIFLNDEIEKMRNVNI